MASKGNEQISEKQKILYSKYNSLLLKEKLLLNEKVIFQHFFEREFNSEMRNNEFERFFTNNINKAIGLELAQKYEVVRRELENANKKWELFEKRKDELTDELLAKNQETISSIKDIKKEVYELNRKIDIQGENTKTGKISAELFEKFFADKKVKLEALEKKLTEQNKNLRKSILTVHRKLEKKEKGTELEFIDFHQLQIENKKYVKEVDEKNKLLLKLKMTIGKISQDKNKNKEKLKNAESELEKNTKTIMEKDKEIAKINARALGQKKKETDIEAKTRELVEKHKRSEVKMITIDNHVKQKDIEEKLLNIMSTLKKKLQIENIGGIIQEEKEDDDEVYFG